jgi:hypothetical protein
MPVNPSPYLRWIICCIILAIASIPASAQSFKTAPVIPTSADIISMATADLNHDGKLDLVYVDGLPFNQGTLHILLGKGNGTFTHAADIKLPSGVFSALTLADVTNDGNIDVLLGGSSPLTSTVLLSVLIGNGDGTFQSPVTSSFQQANMFNFPNGSHFAVGDINGDGKADLAILANGYVYLFLGDNSGNFTLGTPVRSSAENEVYLLDLKGDGILDLIATDSLGADFLVYLGKGDGTFPNFTRYTLGNPSGGFFIADMNRDGHPDVLTIYYNNANANQPILAYFPGNPDGTFGAPISLGNDPSPNQLVSVADLNGDGIPDLTYLTASGIGVVLGKSGLTFGPVLTTISGGSTSPYSYLPTTPVVGDFNGDGHADIAMAVEGGIELLFGNGDGTFASADFYDMGQPVGAAAVADFSGHGFPDVAVTLEATFPQLLLGNGTGTFTPGPNPNPNFGAQPADVTILAADFNGDGKPDLNIGNMIANQPSSSTQAVAFNLGNGTFTTPVSLPNSSPIMADFNRDGRTDIINASGLQIVVSLGQKDGSFQSVSTSLNVPFYTGFFNVGDVNNDGKPDLVLNYRDHIEVWFGDGDGTFTFASPINLPGVASVVVAAIADLDGDGNADIILAPDPNPGASLGPLAILYGNGNGTFQAPVFVPIFHRFSQVAAVDINRDNKPDLVMTDGAGIAVMMNLGGRSFGPEVDFVAGRAVSALNVVDVNSDGFPDIVVANPGGTTVTVLLNQPNGASPSGALVNGNLSVTPEPSISGQPFNISLSISGQNSGALIPTGIVGINIDGSFIADASLINGALSYVYSSTLLPGLHTITATYNGDSTYASKSFSVTHLVSPPTYSTQTTLAASPTTLLASQTLRLTATVSSAVSVPAGIVTFLDGTGTLGSASIDKTGTAYFDTALLTAGVHSISARFQGYSQQGVNFITTYVSAIFSPSTSAAESVAVTANATTVALISSAGSATAGKVLTFTAQVNANAGIPFGGVSFYDGSSLLGSLSLESTGSASFSTASLAVGPHNISAAYSANGPYGGSTSNVLNTAVTPVAASTFPTMVSLAPQLNSTNGISSLIATVSSLEIFSSGAVTFLDSGKILGTAPVDASGTARLANVQMNSGIHMLTASFGGTPQYAPAVSPVLTEQWPSDGPGFSLLVFAAPLPASESSPPLLEVKVNLLSDFRQVVGLSCVGGLPSGYSCSFTPNALNGAGSSVLQIVAASKTAYWHSAVAGWFVAAGLVFAVLLGSGTRREYQFLFLLLVISASAVLNGCGSMTQSLESPRTFVLTVQATSTSSSEKIIHSAQVPVWLQEDDSSTMQRLRRNSSKKYGRRWMPPISGTSSRRTGSALTRN